MTEVTQRTMEPIMGAARIMFMIAVLVEVFVAGVCVWINWMYIKRAVNRSLNVLQVMSLGLTGVNYVFMITVVCISIIYFAEIHVNLTTSILMIEVSNFFMELSFAVSSGMAVIKILLVYHFDEMHSKDPLELAGTTIAGASLAVFLPSLAITINHLYKQEIVHPAAFGLMGLDQGKAVGINFSMFLIAIHFLTAVLLVVLAKVLAKWRFRRNVTQAVRVGESNVKKTPPPPTSPGPTTGQEKQQDKFSIRKVIYGLVSCFFAVVLTITRNYGPEDQGSQKEFKKLGESFVVSTLLMLCVIYFSLTKKVRKYAWRKFCQALETKYGIKLTPRIRARVSPGHAEVSKQNRDTLPVSSVE